MSLAWLNSEALTMLGPYLSHVTPDDVDSSPKEYVRDTLPGKRKWQFGKFGFVPLLVYFLHILFQLCEFFRTAQFKSALRVATKLKPSLASRFLRRFQECFSEEEFMEHVDKCVFIHECLFFNAQNLWIRTKRYSFLSFISPDLSYTDSVISWSDMKRISYLNAIHSLSVTPLCEGFVFYK